MRRAERASAGRRARERLRIAALLVGLVSTAVGCGGCSPTYVLRAAYEESRILWSREPIDELLGQANPAELSERERKQLELVQAARKFAEDELGLSVGGAYGSLADVPPGALLWVVSAAERLHLRPYSWWFPIVGSVTYKGFFDSAEAEAEADSLEEKGYDTFVRRSAAFSTLGWFDDPVLSPWLESTPVGLVQLVLHELLHRTTYLPGKTDFNESFASFVGNEGAVAFFAVHDGPEAETTLEARKSVAEELDLSRRWGSAVDRLRALYRDGSREKRPEAEILDDRGEIFAELGPADRINNAVVLARYAYMAHLDRFGCALEEAGGDLRAAIARVRLDSEKVSGDDDPFDVLPVCAAPPVAPAAIS
ncbi:MAG: hypothetical protein FJ144_12025 [Deltaproteobacteria bacterium]|nr:hypothetical protein [Deltaproteobacteria bacterium]